MSHELHADQAYHGKRSCVRGLGLQATALQGQLIQCGVGKHGAALIIINKIICLVINGSAELEPECARRRKSSSWLCWTNRQAELSLSKGYAGNLALDATKKRGVKRR